VDHGQPGDSANRLGGFTFPDAVSVERPVDDTHAAFTELLLNLVMRQGLARRSGLRTVVDLDVGGSLYARVFDWTKLNEIIAG
jgi:hypothetical protein